jgi:hypothetical protein
MANRLSSGVIKIMCNRNAHCLLWRSRLLAKNSSSIFCARGIMLSLLRMLGVVSKNVETSGQFSLNNYNFNML